MFTLFIVFSLTRNGDWIQRQDERNVDPFSGHSPKSQYSRQFGQKHLIGIPFTLHLIPRNGNSNSLQVCKLSYVTKILLFPSNETYK